MRPHRVYVVLSVALRPRNPPTSAAPVHLIAWCHTPEEAEAMRLKLEEQRGRYIEAWGPPHVHLNPNHAADTLNRDEFVAQMIDQCFLSQHRAFSDVEYMTAPVLDDPSARCHCAPGPSIAKPVHAIHPDCPHHAGDEVERAKRDRVREGTREAAPSFKDRISHEMNRPLEVGEEVRLVNQRVVRRRASGVRYGVVDEVRPNGLVLVRGSDSGSVLFVDGHALPRTCASCRGAGRIDRDVDGDRGRDCYICAGIGRLPAAIGTVGEPRRCVDCGHTRNEHGEILDGGTECMIGENDRDRSNRCACRAWRAP